MRRLLCCTSTSVGTREQEYSPALAKHGSVEQHASRAVAPLAEVAAPAARAGDPPAAPWSPAAPASHCLLRRGVVAWQDPLHQRQFGQLQGQHGFLETILSNQVRSEADLTTSAERTFRLVAEFDSAEFLSDMHIHNEAASLTATDTPRESSSARCYVDVFGESYEDEADYGWKLTMWDVTGLCTVMQRREFESEALIVSYIQALHTLLPAHAVQALTARSLENGRLARIQGLEQQQQSIEWLSELRECGMGGHKGPTGPTALFAIESKVLAPSLRLQDGVSMKVLLKGTLDLEERRSAVAPREMLSGERMSVQECNDAAAAELLRWTQRQDSEVLTTEDMESLAMNHDQVSLVFTDIKGFTNMSEQTEPRTLLLYLNRLFSAYDALAEKWGIYKVETVGDAYVACAGLMTSKVLTGGSGARNEGSLGSNLSAVVRATHAGLDDSISSLVSRVGSQSAGRLLHSGSCPGFHTSAMPDAPCGQVSELRNTVRFAEGAASWQEELAAAEAEWIAQEDNKELRNSQTLPSNSENSLRDVALHTWNIKVPSVRENGDPQHALRMLLFSIEVSQVVKQIINPIGAPTEVRFGIHTGSIASGVIGTKSPRFCLFGDTMNVTSRMESTGEPGHLHVSKAFADLLPQVQWTERLPTITVKGKGKMRTFWFPTYSDVSLADVKARLVLDLQESTSESLEGVSDFSLPLALAPKPADDMRDGMRRSKSAGLLCQLKQSVSA